MHLLEKKTLPFVPEYLYLAEREWCYVGPYGANQPGHSSVIFLFRPTEIRVYIYMGENTGENCQILNVKYC